MTKAHRFTCRMATLSLVLASVGAAIAKEIGTTALLFENVRVFDGTNTTLSPPSNVLVIGDKIAKVSREPVAAPHDVAVRRVAGDGRTLMPGLIDAHWHSMLVAPDMTTAIRHRATGSLPPGRSSKKSEAVPSGHRRSGRGLGKCLTKLGTAWRYDRLPT